MKVFHQNLLFSFGGNTEGDPRNEQNWKDIGHPQDSISADNDNRGSETEVVSADPKPVVEGDAIYIQHIQIEVKLNYWTQFMWNWLKALYECQ